MKKAFFLAILISGLLIGYAHAFWCYNVIVITSNAQYNIVSNEFNYIEIDGAYMTMNYIKIKVLTPSNMHFNLIHIRNRDYGEVIAFKPLNKSIDINLQVQFNIDLAGDPAVRGAQTFSWNPQTKILSLTAKTNEFSICLTYWWETQIPMYMGIIGFLFLILSPVLCINGIKNEEYQWLAYSFLMAILGIGMIVGWLWS